MIMGAIWIAVVAFALVCPLHFWKHKPLGMRLLVGLGLFASPFGIGLIIDGVRGGVFVLGAGVISLIAVTYFDMRLRQTS